MLRHEPTTKPRGQDEQRRREGKSILVTLFISSLMQRSSFNRHDTAAVKHASKPTVFTGQPTLHYSKSSSVHVYGQTSLIEI